MLLFLTMKLYVHSSLEHFPDQDHVNTSGDSLPYKIVNQAKLILFNIILFVCKMYLLKCVDFRLERENASIQREVLMKER